MDSPQWSWVLTRGVYSYLTCRWKSSRGWKSSSSSQRPRRASSGWRRRRRPYIHHKSAHAPLPFEPCCNYSPVRLCNAPQADSTRSVTPILRTSMKPLPSPQGGSKSTYHPTYLFLVNMAAMGIVEAIVDPNSGASLLDEGSW